MDLKYKDQLKHCAGYLHFRCSVEATEAILFLHGYSEAASYNGWTQQGAIRLLRHPLPAYFCASRELVNVEGWRQGDPEWGLPPENVCRKWQKHYELFAPQKRQSGPWTETELKEVRDTIMFQRSHWHLAGTSFGGAGALQLIKLSGMPKFLSLGLACPKPYPGARGELPPAWTRYGTKDLSDVIAFCEKHKHRLEAVPMVGKGHPYVCRHAYAQGYFEWLHALRTARSNSELPRST